MSKRKRKRPRIQIDARAASRLITFFGILSAIVITVWVWIIYQPGRKSHEHLLTEHTKFRLSLQPAQAQDYISSLAPGITRFISVVPKFTSMQARAIRVDWIHALPYEITFLADQDAPDALGFTLYVNTIPDKGSFVSEVNASGALRGIRSVHWNGGQLVSAAEQQFSAKGSVPIPDEARQLLEAWPKATGSLARYDGGHLIEVAADNSGGVLLALHRGFRREFWDWASEETNASLVTLWPQIARVEVVGDLTHNDELSFTLKITGNRIIDQNVAGPAIEAAAADLTGFLERAQLTFTGEGAWTNSITYEAHYRLTNFEARVHHIWRE